MKDEGDEREDILGSDRRNTGAIKVIIRMREQWIVTLLKRQLAVELRRGA